MGSGFAGALDSASSVFGGTVSCEVIATYNFLMTSLRLNLPDRLASLLRERAAQRGETIEAFAVGIFVASPLLAEQPQATESDLLEAFLGCGASGDSRDLSVEVLRNELSESQLAKRR
jgi:hypothetical protein